ncbi:hypothetical protein GCM10025865_05430 [Paraoerskovia sediminicola]|uniref:Lipoprotein LpqN n=1 Tax=Paraoerskovia sediminicola TaxID=1138587 RepID=A0ABM8FZJ4_9CELL|nr:hypothetical protein [Paraoerskovia sediminicola]BDZ41244.1 hypothetical protein GCM10025865_05430 [Paraoerskovia sediminicola]
MRTASYPSPTFPGPPSVDLDVLDGWEPVTGLGPAITLERTGLPGATTPKVEVVITRMRDWESLDDASMKIAGALEKLSGYEELARDAEPVAGHAGFRLEAVVRNPTDRARYVQAIRYALVDRGETRDLVQIMGSCTGAQRDAVLDEIRAIQDSVRIAV